MYRNDKELSNCTFVKAVLMLFVVFYHCCIWWCDSSWFVREPTYRADYTESLCSWMNSFHIYAFVLTSGYIYYYLRNELHKYEGFLGFLNNKLKRLVVPYIFASIAWVIPTSIFLFKYNTKDILLKFALGTAPSQLWFLLMLFVVFVCVWPLNRIINEHIAIGIAFSVCTYFCGVLAGANALNIFQIWTGLKYISFFILGFYLRKFYLSIPKKTVAIFSVVLHLSLLYIETKISASASLYLHIAKVLVYYLSHISGAVAAFYVLQSIACSVSGTFRELINRLGRKSMTIYLVHQQIIYVFLLLLDGKVNAIQHITICYIGTMIISLLIASVLSHFSITRKLVGSK